MVYYVVLKDAFKPPLLIFCITLIALAVTLFAYSVSIELSNGKMLNPDIQSWNNFTKAVSGLSVCLVTGASKKAKTKMKNLKTPSSETNVTKVSFLIDSSLVIQEKLQKYYFVQVSLSAEEIGFLKSDDNIEMNISMSKSKENVNSLTCLSIRGPSYLLPSSEVTLPNCSTPKSSPKQKLILMSPTKVHDEAFCHSKVFGTLKFVEQEKLNIYLSQMDLSLMQLHIFVSSSVLCAMILSLFLYSLLGKTCRKERKLPSDLDTVFLD